MNLLLDLSDKKGLATKTINAFEPLIPSLFPDVLYIILSSKLDITISERWDFLNHICISKLKMISIITVYIGNVISLVGLRSTKIILQMDVLACNAIVQARSMSIRSRMHQLNH
jgi:hypothetical protein